LEKDVANRVEDAIRAVVPPKATVRRDGAVKPFVGVRINGHPLRAYWIGEGWPRQVKEAIARLGSRRPDVFVARRMSEGAQAEASRAGVGWIDETGGAEVALDWLVIARTAREVPDQRPTKWTPAVLGVAEALLTGTKPTVAETTHATGLSVDRCTRALAFFTELGVLTAQASRGPTSARRLADADRLLDQYAAAASTSRGGAELRVGVLWNEPINGLADLGKRWDAAGTKWAVTGAVAAALLAPLLTDSSTAEVFVERQTLGALERVAQSAAVKPMEGGRLLLRPFPSPVTARLSRKVGRLSVAPWPRIYAELRTYGVRGEDAAEHLREKMDAK